MRLLLTLLYRCFTSCVIFKHIYHKALVRTSGHRTMFPTFYRVSMVIIQRQQIATVTVIVIVITISGPLLKKRLNTWPSHQSYSQLK